MNDRARQLDLLDRLHHVLDADYDAAELVRLLDNGADPDAVHGPDGEAALHAAVRRRRGDATGILLDRGVRTDARTRGGKTAYVHAIRRGFDEVAELLAARGADTALSPADTLAVALTHGEFGRAREILTAHPETARTGNPEEDRILADVAGRNADEPVRMLMAAGADLEAAGLDGGTPLHQAAWFGQPLNARRLIDAGAPLDRFDPVHQSTPLHWAVHGSRYSGGAESRQDAYVSVTRMLLEAGSRLTYPESADPGAYARRLLRDASPAVRGILLEFGVGGSSSV